MAYGGNAGWLGAAEGFAEGNRKQRPASLPKEPDHDDEEDEGQRGAAEGFAEGNRKQRPAARQKNKSTMIMTRKGSGALLKVSPKATGSSALLPNQEEKKRPMMIVLHARGLQ